MSVIGPCGRWPELALAEAESALDADDESDSNPDKSLPSSELVEDVDILRFQSLHDIFSSLWPSSMACLHRVNTAPPPVFSELKSRLRFVFAYPSKVRGHRQTCRTGRVLH